MTGSLAAPFLAAAQEGRLLVQSCASCGARQLPPRLCCESCGSSSLEWTAAAGTATLRTFAVLHRAPDEIHRERLPYVYAVVKLDEGPRMISNLIEIADAELHDGLRVRVRFEQVGDDDQRWPVFVPDDVQRA